MLGNTCLTRLWQNIFSHLICRISKRQSFKRTNENYKKGSYLASVTNICKLLDISKRSYKNTINNVLGFYHLNCIPLSRQWLTNSEENFLITEMSCYQIGKDCLTG